MGAVILLEHDDRASIPVGLTSRIHQTLLRTLHLIRSALDRIRADCRDMDLNLGKDHFPLRQPNQSFIETGQCLKTTFVDLQENQRKLGIEQVCTLGCCFATERIDVRYTLEILREHDVAYEIPAPPNHVILSFF